MKTYDCFVRTWWRENPSWPQGLEPCLGEKTYIAHGLSWSEARETCEEYNNSHDPGRLSEKAEFEEA